MRKNTKQKESPEPNETNKQNIPATNNVSFFENYRKKRIIRKDKQEEDSIVDTTQRGSLSSEGNSSVALSFTEQQNQLMQQMAREAQPFAVIDTNVPAGSNSNQMSISGIVGSTRPSKKRRFEEISNSEAQNESKKKIAELTKQAEVQQSKLKKFRPNPALDEVLRELSNDPLSREELISLPSLEEVKESSRPEIPPPRSNMEARESLSLQVIAQLESLALSPLSNFPLITDLSQSGLPSSPDHYYSEVNDIRSEEFQLIESPPSSELNTYGSQERPNAGIIQEDEPDLFSSPEYILSPDEPKRLQTREEILVKVITELEGYIRFLVKTICFMQDGSQVGIRSDQQLEMLRLDMLRCFRLNRNQFQLS